MAVSVEALAPELLPVLVEEAAFEWHEVLGACPDADTGAIRRAMTGLALICHPERRQPRTVGSGHLSLRGAVKQAPATPGGHGSAEISRARLVSGADATAMHCKGLLVSTEDVF